ncbi:MAG: hydantoinase/oxoprolinase family protein [Rhodospirillaceae bacterium]
MSTSASSPNGLRLAADIGGTFTDIAAFDETTGQLYWGKALSTPSALVQGISNGVEKTGLAMKDATLFLHGSTIAINTILERTGAETALVITEGFRDVYEIGRVNRPDAYNLFFKKHVPLIDRAHRFEVPERMYAEGDIRTPLDEAKMTALAKSLKGSESVAVLFLHAYANPVHEIRAKEILEQECPGLFVSVSHELSQEYREYERCSTVAANAYIGPKVRDYLAGIEDHIRDDGFDGPFLVVQSTGGLYEAEQAKSECIRMLESGPAAGVIGTKALCEIIGLDDAISFDMGGTTAKSGVIYKGEVLTTGNTLVGGYDQGLPIQISMMDIFEVGTGGGSLAYLDEAGALHVGPQSAGADPGPACYGLGGDRPTVTDANLVLGRLDGDKFLGGEMTLDKAAAEKAIETHIAKPLNLDVTQAADGILRIASTAMSYAVKGVSTERGLDAAAFAMVAYGGAGPLHATQVAREIGMKQIIIPLSPGNYSSFGMLFSDLRYDYVRTAPGRLTDIDFDQVETLYAEMAEQGRTAIERTSIAPEDIIVSRAADMRYVGQEHPVAVPLPDSLFEGPDREGMKQAFDEVHKIRYGTNAPAEPAEIVSLRCSVTGLMPVPELASHDMGDTEPARDAVTGTRPVFFHRDQGFVEATCYDRTKLTTGNVITGPAVIEEHASTTLLPPGDTLEVDAYLNLVISVGGA